MIPIAHLIGVLFGVIMLILTFILYKRRKFTFDTFLLWAVVWSGIIIGILSFEQVTYIAEVLIKIEVMDFFLYFSILVLFVMVFLVYNIVRSNQKKIERMVENIALRERNTKKKGRLK